MDQLTSGKPVITILTVVAALIAVIVGGVVTITNPQTLTFHQYVQDLAFMAGAIGLGAGIGRGIDSHGQAITSATLQQQPSQPPGGVAVSTTDPTTIPAEPQPDEPTPEPAPGEPQPAPEPAPQPAEPQAGFVQEPPYS